MLCIAPPSRFNEGNWPAESISSSTFLNYEVQIVNVLVFVLPRNLLALSGATALSLLVEIEPTLSAERFKLRVKYLFEKVPNDLTEAIGWCLSDLTRDPT